MSLLRSVCVAKAAVRVAGECLVRPELTVEFLTIIASFPRDQRSVTALQPDVRPASACRGSFPRHPGLRVAQAIHSRL